MSSLYEIARRNTRGLELTKLERKVRPQDGTYAEVDYISCCQDNNLSSLEISKAQLLLLWDPPISVAAVWPQGNQADLVCTSSILTEQVLGKFQTNQSSHQCAISHHLTLKILITIEMPNKTRKMIICLQVWMKAVA